MAVAMLMRYPGVTAKDYDRLMLDFHLDADPPVGEILHLAVESDEGLLVTDVWRTPEAAEAFVQNRLRPALEHAGIKTELEYEIRPLHNVYTPDLDALERIGALSLPAVDVRTVL
jgi:hypothetical protein